MQKLQAEHISELITSLIFAINKPGDNQTQHAAFVSNLRRLLSESFYPVLTNHAADPATLAPEPAAEFAREYSKLVTKDGHELRIGYEYALYRRHTNTETNCAEVHPINGRVNTNGVFEIHRQGGIIIIETINDLYWSNASAQASFEPAGINTADGVALWQNQSVTLYLPHSGQAIYGKVFEHTLEDSLGCLWAAGTMNFHKSNTAPISIPRANGWRKDDKPHTWRTKDAQDVRTGSLQALWHVVDLTGEIAKLNGRVDMAGNLFEIVGTEGEEIPATFPINELYFWRVNLLKDQFAAESAGLTPADEPLASEVDSLN